MKRGRRIFFILLACGVVAVVVALAWPREREPVYRGKRLSEWVLAEAQHQAQGSRDAETVDAIRHIGTNGLPFLVRWIQYRTPPVKQRVINTLLVRGWGNGVVMNRLTRKENLAGIADQVFGILGPEGRPAIPELGRVMRKWEPDTSARAMFTLRRLGGDGLVALLAVVTNCAVDPYFRCGALANIGMMGYLGTNGSVAVPILVQCLGDSDVAVAAASTLGSLGLGGDVAVAALASCLQATNHNLRIVAINSLGQFGKAASGAVPVLVQALTAADPLTVPLPSRGGRYGGGVPFMYPMSMGAAATNALREIAPEVLGKAGGHGESNH